MTARWVVDEVFPARDLNITWQPISLLLKNEPAEDSDYFTPVNFTHKLLRVMESVREAEGDDAVFPLYWEYGRRLHHDQDRDFTAVQALEAIGFDTGHAAAFDDESWDAEIRERMDDGLALTGNDVGTPIIAFDDDEGERVALFGPVITRVPSTEQSLKLWDGFVACATIPGFWELKRTRTEHPEFGERP
ncbi:MAG: disulfide bond formation protein DsbA [Actinomycetia bacterium]|nr:disulfide bond formation protein DsbA [Actinomycetes bacterium]